LPKDTINVSVIVTTFNRKELLKETIDSILNQTYRDFELIIVDNYSDYNFVAFINSYKDDRIRAYQNQNDGVIAVNRNYGIKKAKGDYIAFCDDDDIWLPEKLSIQVKLLIDGKLGICYTNSILVDANNKGIYYKKFKNKYYSPSFVSFFLSGGYICNSSVVIKSECINVVGIFDESEDLIAIEDSEYWARILLHYKGCFVDKALVRYRLHNSNSQTSVFIERLRKNIKLIQSLDSKIGVKFHLKCLKIIKLIMEKILRKLS